MRILVTGGAGYIGSVLVPELLLQGYEVVVLDNFLFEQTSLNALCAEPNFDVVRGDARDIGTLVPLLKGVDVVIPLAALVGVAMCKADQIGARSTNLGAICTLTKLMSPDQRMVIPITNSGYGVGQGDKHCTEDTPMRPISLYGITKCEAEQEAMRRENCVSFRLATVFGMSPRMRVDLLVNDFTYRAVNDRALVLFEAGFKRNYIHVRDVARAFVYALEQFDEMKGEAYNVGLSNANLSKLELCEVIRRHVPEFRWAEDEIGQDPDKRDYIVSNEKLEAMGFYPSYSLDDGIRELIKGYAMLRNGIHGNG